MLETELKVALTKEQYEQIQRELTFKEGYEQINFYYAPQGLEDVKGRPTIRIRSKKGRMQLEAKVPAGANEGSVKMHEEYAKDISCIPGTITADEVSALTNGQFAEDVCLLGYLKTYRQINTEYAGTEVALDMNEYLGVTDYELEIEYEDELPKELLNRLDFLDVEFDKSVTGKYRRFITRRKILDQ